MKGKEMRLSWDQDPPDLMGNLELAVDCSGIPCHCAAQDHTTKCAAHTWRWFPSASSASGLGELCVTSQDPRKPSNALWRWKTKSDNFWLLGKGAAVLGMAVHCHPLSLSFRVICYPCSLFFPEERLQWGRSLTARAFRGMPLNVLSRIYPTVIFLNGITDQKFHSEEFLPK